MPLQCTIYNVPGHHASHQQNSNAMLERGIAILLMACAVARHIIMIIIIIIIIVVHCSGRPLQCTIPRTPCHSSGERALTDALHLKL